MTGGGARSALWRQILADVVGYPIHTLQAEEGPAFGVALLAGVGTSIWSNVPEACEATVRLASHTEPNQQHHEVYERTYALYRELYPALRPLFEQI